MPPGTLNTKITTAVLRLNQIFPLAKNHSSLEPGLAMLHNTILQTYACTGSAPSLDDLSHISDSVSDLLIKLEEIDLILLNDNGKICGAYPFSSQTRAHKILINRRSVNCMCALDGLAVSTLFNQATILSSQCALRAKPIRVHQNNCDILNLEECNEVYLTINWAAACTTARCADSLCEQISFILGAAHADTWQSQSDYHEIFTLAEAVQFASLFFQPLRQESKVV